MPPRESSFDLRNLLTSAEIFSGLSSAEVEKIVAICREVKFAAGQTIFEEGSEGTDLYFIPEGRVSVELSLPGGSTGERIYQAKDSEIVGELALIDGHRRSATTRAIDPVILIAIDRGDFLSLVEENTHIGYVVMSNLCRILARKVRDTNIALRNSLMQNF